MYLWTTPDDYPERLIGTYDVSASQDRFSLKQGRPLSVEGTAMVVRFRCDASSLVGIDDLANTAMVPIVSPKIQGVLKAYCPADVQFLDVQVLAFDGEVAGYKLVNVTTNVKAIDHQASNYKLIPGTQAIMKFGKLALRPGALGEHAVARDSEYLSHVVVSDSLATHLRAVEPKQLGLYRPEEMAW